MKAKQLGKSEGGISQEQSNLEVGVRRERHDSISRDSEQIKSRGLQRRFLSKEVTFGPLMASPYDSSSTHGVTWRIPTTIVL